MEAYLLRAHWTEQDPGRLWDSYIQLTEAEAAFRTLKSEVNIRPIWHWLERRVEAHVMVAFLGYCLWVCLKHRLRAVAPSLTPWQALDQLGRISLVEVWFELKTVVSYVCRALRNRNWCRQRCWTTGLAATGAASATGLHSAPGPAAPGRV